MLQIGIDGKRVNEKSISGIAEHESNVRLKSDRAFITSALRDGISRSFTCGSTVDVANIKPVLEFCRTDDQFELFRFCRLLQSVAAPRLLYRQIAIIVRDAGQNGTPVIGVAGLASSVYSLRCRDELFGWTSNRLGIRNRGLQRCMQLGVCMAVPPYSGLRGAKLVAALAASQEVAEEYRLRYHEPLLAIVTTAARGIHTPIFNRIMLRPGGLYKRIGQTTGYSALVFSDDTVAAAKDLVTATDGACPATTDRPIRVLKRAMNLCCVPRERFMRLGVPKGVYAAWPSRDALDGLLKTECRIIPEWPTAEEVITYWKTRELMRVVARKSLLGSFRSSGWSDVLDIIGG